MAEGAPDSGTPVRRRTFLKWLVSAFALLLIAAAVGAWYLRKNFSSEKIKAEISALALKHSGFSITIDEVDLTWSGDVRLKRICLKNPRMVSGRCFVSANVVSLDLALAPLLKKQVEVRGAHFDLVEVNFFTERPAGTKTDIGSWQGEEVAHKQSVADAQRTDSEARFRLKSLRVTNGAILHEVRVLPLPLGKTVFDAKLDYAAERQHLTGAMQFADASRVDADLNIESANLIGFVRQIAAGQVVGEANKTSGTLKCTGLSLAAFDPRLQSLNGSLAVQSSGQVMTLRSETAAIGVLQPLRLNLVWAGEAGIDIVKGTLTSGHGKLIGPGLAIEYSELGVDQKQNLRVHFGIAGELSVLAGQISGANTLKGNLHIAGKYENAVPSAHLKVTNLAAQRGGLPALSAEVLHASLKGKTIAFSKQKLALGGQAFDATASIQFAGSTPVASGSVDFKVLKPNQLFSGEKSQGAEMELAPFSAQFVSTAAGVRLDKISTGFSRGTITGSYAYDSAGERHTARLNLSRIKTQDLSEALKLKATVFAVLDGRCDLAFSGTNLDAIKKNVTGTLSAAIGRGKIKDSFLQKGILNGPLHKLEEKFSDTEFESASIEATFNAGAVSLKKLSFDAGEFDVSMRAEAASGGQGKATLNFRFRSSFVENVANPLHMGIETLREGDYYNLPFACRGDVFSSACYVKNW